MAHTIKVHKSYVAYRLEECRWKGTEHDTEDHQCESECTWMNGDRRELRPSDTYEYEPDHWDLDEHGTPVEWAVAHLTRHYAELTESTTTGDTARASEWISGSYEDAYRGDLDVTETSAYLVGDWTEKERAEVFRRVTGRR